LPAVADNAAMQTELPKTDPPKRKRRWFQFSLRTLLVLPWIGPRRKDGHMHQVVRGITMSHPLSKEAETVVETAYDEARRSKKGYAGTEHLLIALIKESRGAAASVLKHFGIDARSVQSEMTKIDSNGLQMTGRRRLSRPIRTTVLKTTLKLAVEEARSKDEEAVDSEHVLLALARNEDSIAAEILKNLGVTVDGVSSQLQRLQDR
jgi:ATP-dependent Clp protease ATP-binding subunit ClpC